MSMQTTDAWPGPRKVAPLLAVAAAVRVVAIVVTSRGPLTSDPAAYFHQAVAVAHHSLRGPFYWPAGTSVAFVPWIAVLGGSDVVARVAAGTFSLLLVPGVMMLAVAVFRDRRVTLCAGWAMALYPPAVLMAGDPQSHVIAGLLGCVLVAAVIHAAETGRTAWWVAAGVSLGGLAITRPATLLLVLLPVLLLFLRRREDSTDASTDPADMSSRGTLATRPATRQSATRPAMPLWGGFAIVVVTSAAVMVPVAIHNVDSGSGLTLATNDSVNLFFGNNPFTPLYWTSALASGHKSDAFKQYRASLTRNGDDDTVLRSEALRYVLHHPAETALRSVNRARAFWGFDYYRTSELRAKGWPTPAVASILVLEAGGYLVALCLALAGFVGPLASKRTWRRDLLVVAAALLYLPYVLSFSVGIYHFAVIVLLMPVIGTVVSRVASDGVLTSVRAAITSRPLMLVLAIAVLIQAEYAYWLIRYS